MRCLNPGYGRIHFTWATEKRLLYGGQGGNSMLSDNIKNLRKQKGYTQETLAQALNIVRQTVSKWEKGYSVPDADMLEKIAEVLEVQVTDILGTPSEPEERSTELEKVTAQLTILNDQLAREMARRKRSRKIRIIIVSVILGLLLTGIVIFLIPQPFSGLYAGDTSLVEVRQTPSDLYTQDEINNAIEVIKREFENWNGCKLHLIYYAGDDVCAEETKNRGVQTMVLLSDFTAVNPGGDSGLNSNHTYHNWNWILIKNEKGQWEHIDHGY